MKARINEIKNELALILALVQSSNVRPNKDVLRWCDVAHESYVTMLRWYELGNEDLFLVSYNNTKSGIELSLSRFGVK